MITVLKGAITGQVRSRIPVPARICSYIVQLERDVGGAWLVLVNIGMLLDSGCPSKLE